jgi:acyl-CoA synthetase (NDP forming)
MNQSVVRPMARLVTPERLASFFSPQRLAIVGATENSFWTRNAIRNLEVLGFSGELILVNPRRSTAFGRPCVESLRHVDRPVDLAYVVAPTSAVPNIIDDAVDTKVRSAVIVAAGFGEVGEHGTIFQDKVVRQALAGELTFLGPNCPGFLNASRNVAAYGQEIPVGLQRGPVSVVLQSGALATAVLKFSNAYGIGLSTVVCMGNEAVIRAADVLEHLIVDPNTSVIAMFLEQIRDGERFLELARQALALGKAIVMLKVGRTPTGQRTALAHTGAVAGNETVIDAALRQVGVVRVRGLEELLFTAGLLAHGPKLKGNRMGVVTSSGGACDIIADRASDEGIELPAFSPEVSSALAEYLPDFATVQNPLDGAAVDTMQKTQTAAVPMDVVAEIVSRDTNFDFLVYMGFNMVPFIEPSQPERDKLVARMGLLGHMIRNSSVPILPMTQTCLDVGQFARTQYQANGIFLLGGIEFGMSAIGNAVRWEAAHARAADREKSMLATRKSTPVHVGQRGAWSEASSRDFLRAAGATVVPAELVQTIDEAIQAADRFKYPVVLKICSRDIPHKSDIGGVALNVRNQDEMGRAFSKVRASADLVAGASVDGILVSPMRERGVELYVGVTVDPTFGPTLAVGLGGVWIEVLKDVALRVLPVTLDEIEAMLRSLKARPLLEGARGGPVVDISAAAIAIAEIAEAALLLGENLETFEVNPLWCLRDKAEALDVLVVTAHSQEPGEPT